MFFNILQSNYLTLMPSKVPFSLEYDFHASPQLLFQYLSTPSGLSEWFADNVNLNGKNYKFFWDGDEQEAELLSKKNNLSVKFRWTNEPKDTFFELKIVIDDITQDVSLIITDFAEDEEDLEEAKLLWNKQIEKLRQSIGS